MEITPWITIPLSLLPGFAWLMFYIQEDPRKEPLRAIVKTFFMGGAFAFFALASQIALEKITGPITTSGSVNALILFALSEELFKFLAAYTSIHKSPAFSEPLDGMLYAIIAALGFATVENLGAIAGQATLNPVLFTELIGATTLRFAGATLLHTLSSGIIGFYWTRSLLKNNRLWLFWGFVIGCAIHIAFNFLVLASSAMGYALAFCLLVGLFVLYDYEELNNEHVNIQG